MVQVLWERHIGSVMFYLLDMARERRQACPSVVVKEKQWSFSEKGPLGYGRMLIVYAGSGPPRHTVPRQRTRRCIYNCDPKESRSAIL